MVAYPPIPVLLKHRRHLPVDLMFRVTIGDVSFRLGDEVDEADGVDFAID